MSERLASAQLLEAAQLQQVLLALRDRALEAGSVAALAFTIANDPYPLLRFRQALVFACEQDAVELLAVSGLARPTEDSPYLVWLRGAARWVAAQLTGDAPAWLARAALAPPPAVAEGWAEWWPAGVWCVPLHGRDGARLGLVLYLLEAEPPSALAGQLDGVRRTWAYCWSALRAQRPLLGWRPTRRHVLVAAGVLAALLLVPVRQTALAPAQIISLRSQVVTSPIDGVIRQLHVRPNQQVQAGTPLFTLDETTLANRADVLGKQVAVADAELMAASQRAFDNAQTKGELALLASRAQQRRAELAAVLAQLERTQVLAPAAGVAVYGDPNDWLGRPVATGERVLLVADPAQPAIRIELAVADAIALERGAPVTLYLSAWPLQPLRGEVLETSYQARPSDEGVVSYRLLASIEGAPAHARLGLHGTAKLHGDRVPLAYYLLRRPLAALRAWTGW